MLDGEVRPHLMKSAALYNIYNSWWGISIRKYSDWK